jgi:hypothetical protein
MKTLTDLETFTESRIKIVLRLTIQYLCHWSVFSAWSPLIGQGKSRPKYTCHERFTEEFSEAGASFTVTGGFLNAATITLKRDTGRIFKIMECFQRSKEKLGIWLS